MSYAMTIRLSAGFAPTRRAGPAALKDQGFGVLTEIDMRATLHEKLGVELEEYVILGPATPRWPTVPCRPTEHRPAPTVQRRGPRRRADATLVQALDPQVMVQLSDAADLRTVADEATRRLRAALDALSG
ncbi:DUF302 domain-containing protein [Micromonospora sp. b486]|uniref:DUF302 domain-containing protein n=1 Tax=Micromonospora sp. b486 TaxID=3053986 RepID=UPI00259CD1E0|nr:DUF302 domain-containing protein [Micromonospora sp. b486]MDM4784659.1 DUF302 domain-containing protein [Micromonospora sp. b486]